MTDVAKIAASLSEAQRRAILILSGQWVSRMLPERIIWLDPSILETAAPLRSGHERVRLTPLGLAVRAHLLANTPGDANEKP
jgi:hypothetical protein